MTKLTIACTARTLFDLDESHQIFINEGVEAYSKYQLENEDNTLEPGSAYSLIRKLLSLNTSDSKLVEVVLLSRNSPETGLRVFNSLKTHGLDINRAAFTRGLSPSPYMSAFGVDLFLSSEPSNVEAVLRDGFAAATVLPSAQNTPDDCLKVAFDGDAVLFSDDSERLYQEQGLSEFTRSENDNARTPLSDGPFKNFLLKLHDIQKTYPEESSPIRTALVTARATPTSERVIRTLQSWNVHIDETFFLGGGDKGAVLKAFGADIFFDDHLKHCESARHHVTTCHVPNVVAHPAAITTRNNET